jgi:hypothetical protein
MTVTTAIASTFKPELMRAIHNMDVGGDTLMMALQKVGPGRNYDQNTQNFSAVTAAPSDELAAGGGYTAGGAACVSAGVTLSGTTGIADFNNVSWASATFSATAAFLYNQTKAGRMIAMWDFGGTQSISGATFVIAMPPSGAGTSLIRIA